MKNRLPGSLSSIFVLSLIVLVFLIVCTGTSYASTKYDAGFVGIDAPGTINVNQNYTVTVTMENTGTEPWQFDSTQSSWVGLVADGSDAAVLTPAGGLNATGYCNPGQTCTFQGTIRAPSAGTYNLQYSLVYYNDHPGKATSFGAAAQKTITAVAATATPSPTATPTPTVTPTTEPTATPGTAQTPTPNPTPGTAAYTGYDASVVSVDFPGTMTVGQSYTARITMKNTGTVGWGFDPNYPGYPWVELDGNNGDADALRVSGFSTSAVSCNPGDQVTFTATIQANSAASYSPQYQLVRCSEHPISANSFGQVAQASVTAVSPTPTPVPRQAYDAAFVRSDIPSTIIVGQDYTVHIVMRNTGYASWTFDPNYNPWVEMTGINNDADALTTPGFTASALSCGPDEEVTFTGTIHANTAGSYNPQYQLYHDSEHPIIANPFGQVAQAQITAKQPLPYDSELLSQDIPSNIVVGEDYTVHITMKNTGTTSWQFDAMQNPWVEMTGINDDANAITVSGFQASSEYCSPGQQVTFTGTIHADTAGVINPQYQLYKCSEHPIIASAFGQTVGSQITVSPTAYDGIVVQNDIPDTLVVGHDYTVNIVMKNTGRSTWTFDANHNPWIELEPDNSDAGAITASGFQPSSVSCGPGETVTFQGTIRANTVGTFSPTYRLYYCSEHPITARPFGQTVAKTVSATKIYMTVDYRNIIPYTDNDQIKIAVYDSSNPPVPLTAHITVKINGEVVGEAYDKQYTYVYVPKQVGDYQLEVTADDGTYTNTYKGKITVIGDISDMLAYNRMIASNTRCNIDNMVMDVSKKTVDWELDSTIYVLGQLGGGSATLAGTSLARQMWGKEVVYGGTVPRLDLLYYAACQKAGFSGGAWDPACFQLLNTAYDKGVWAILTKNPVSTWLLNEVKKPIYDYTSNQIINKYCQGSFTSINNKEADFNNYILLHSDQFLKNQDDTKRKFIVYSQPIYTVMDTYPISSVDLPGGIHGDVTMNKALGWYDYIKLWKSFIDIAILIIIVVVIIAGVIVTLGVALPVAVGAIAAVLGDSAWILGCMSWLEGCVLALTIILLLSNVGNVSDEFAHRYVACDDALKDYVSNAYLGPMSLSAADTSIDSPTALSSNYYSVVVRPDGEIASVFKGDTTYVPNTLGKYSLYSYSNTVNSMEQVTDTSFNVTRPNVSMSLAKSVSGNVVSVDASFANMENVTYDNVSLVLSVTNSSGAIASADMYTFNIGPHAVNNVSRSLTLNGPGTYLVTATVLIQGLYQQQTEKFPVSIGGVPLDSVYLKGVDHRDIYSPYENVTMNVQLESFKDQEVNLSIPEMNYTKKLTFNGTDNVNVVLPVLPPNTYSVNIIAGTDNGVCDHQSVDFLVEAADVGVITLNTTSLLQDPNTNVNVDMVLKDLSNIDIDANVSLKVIDPDGNVQIVGATKNNTGYRASFIPCINGTYVLTAIVDKPGYRIYYDTMYLVVGNMSPLKIDYSVNKGIVNMSVYANGALTDCNATVMLGNDMTSKYLSDGTMYLLDFSQASVTVDKMFYEPATISFSSPVASIRIRNASDNTARLDASTSWSVNGNITSYTWDFGDGTNASVQTPFINHTFANNGSYDITLVVTDSIGLTNTTIKSVPIGSFTPTPIPSPSPSPTPTPTPIPKVYKVVSNVTPSYTEVIPGNVASYGISIKNEGNTADTYTVKVGNDTSGMGVPQGWTSLSESNAWLMPGASSTIGLDVMPPRSWSTAPGNYSFVTTVSSPNAFSSNPAVLRVLNFSEVGISITGGRAYNPPVNVIDPNVERIIKENPSGKVKVLIKTRSKPGQSEKSQIEGAGGKVKYTYHLINGFAAEVPAGKVRDLASKGFVESIELDSPVNATQDASVSAMNVSAVYGSGFDGSGVTVAVLDTGIDHNNAAFPRIGMEYDFVDGDNYADDLNGHGTYVSGVIASNDATYKGVAPGVTLMPVKVLNQYGAGNESDIIAGIEWSVDHGANVISMSLGGAGGNGTSALSQAADNAVARGVIVVTAAGNGGPSSGSITSPGDAFNVITVGAVDNNGTIADFSSRGPTVDGRVKPDVVAPGVGVTSIGLNGGYVSKSGTSVSTAEVAGSAALMVQAYHSTPSEVKSAFMKTAKNLGYDNNTQGAGMLDAGAAYLYLKDLHSPVVETVRPNGTAVYYIEVTNLGNANDTFNIALRPSDLNGKYLAYPSSIQSGWVALNSSVSLVPGGSVNDSVSVSVPANWSGMENATYTFNITATSTTDRNASASATGKLVVCPTKMSMVEYTGLEAGWLADDIRALSVKDSVKNSLLGKLDTASKKNDQALGYLLAGDEKQCDNMLGVEYNSVDSLVNEIDAQSGKGLTASDASALKAKAELLEQHINQAKIAPI